jgi:tetratricopeptide (TPR) repeat protein
MAEVVGEHEQKLETPAAASSGPGALELYSAGLTAFDDGRFEEALQRFRESAALEPAEGRHRIMAGASALKLGRYREAQHEIEGALALRLDPSEEQTAKDYLSVMSRGLASRGLGPELVTQAGSGFDSNVLQSGVARGREVIGPLSENVASPLLLASLAASLRGRLGESLVGEVTYGFDQLAYLAPRAQDYSVQQHGLSGALEWSAGERWRLGVTGGGQAAFTGLGGFRLLQWAGGAGAFAALDETERTSTRLELDWTGKLAGRQEFSYLSGNRLDATLGQTVRWQWLTLEASYRLRDEAIGTMTETAALAPPVPPMACMAGCTSEQIIPVGYLGNTLTLSGRAAVASWLVLRLSGGVERRDFLDDNYLAVRLADGGRLSFDRRRRLDWRGLGSLSASVRPSRASEIVVRYDLIVNRSNIANHSVDRIGVACGPPDFVCHQFDFDDKNYTKHAVSLEFAYGW